MRLPAFSTRLLAGVAGVTAALLLAFTPAPSLAQPGLPVIDGNLQDMIDYANATGNLGCGVVNADPQRDIRVFDPQIIPCVPVVDNYYVNGFDMLEAVVAYRGTNRTLYLGIRVAGVIGDPDGNGNPDTKCAESTFDDQPGIGIDDQYAWELDQNCDGLFETNVTVRNNAVTVNGAPYPGATFARNGSGLEVAVPNFDLSPGVNIRAFSGNVADGLGEDTNTFNCRPPGPEITLDKSANVPSLCPGGVVTYTLVVRNPSTIVPLQQVVLVDNLPPGLEYVAASAQNGCGVGAPQVAAGTLTWPTFELLPGASCTFTFQARRVVEACQGNFVNGAVATGQFAHPCVNGGEPQVVEARDDAVVACEVAPCVDVQAFCEPAEACIGAPVTVRGVARNCSLAPETIVLTVAGQAQTFENVAPGQSVEKIVTVPMPQCTNGQQVPFCVTATAGGSCGQAQPAEACCQVICRVPVIDVEKTGEATVLDGQTIHYSIVVTNTGPTALENITVTDRLCRYAKYADTATPTPTQEPVVGQGGSVIWNIPTLAIGAFVTLSFNATADVAFGGGQCPGEFICTNYVQVEGFCAGSNGQSRATDEDEWNTTITCTSQENCPRTPGFWSAQCAQKQNGSTKFTREQVTMIAECIDETSSFFAWTPGTDFDMFCRNINPPTPMTPRKQAKRQFAAMLANLCTDRLDLVPIRGGKVLLDPSTPVHCDGLHATTIGELITEVDQLLTDLEGQSLNDPMVKEQYGWIISCVDGINNGTNIPTLPGCEETDGSSTPTGDSGEAVDSVDEPTMALYRPMPNPFTASMTFAYEVTSTEGANVSIAVYDLSGRLVAKLFEGSQVPGRHAVAWDGRGETGMRVAPGVYFVRTTIGGQKGTLSRVLFVRG